MRVSVRNEPGQKVAQKRFLRESPVLFVIKHLQHFIAFYN